MGRTVHIDAVSLPVVSLDPTGAIAALNEPFQELLRAAGVPAECAAPATLLALPMAEEDLRRLGATLNETLGGGVTSDAIELRLAWPAAPELARHLLLTLTCERDPASGAVVGAVGIGHDVTRTRAVAAQRADDLARLIDTANAPIFGIDGAGCINEWNQKTAAITGYSKEDVLGRDLLDSLITAEYREEVGAMLRSTLQGATPTAHAFPLCTKQGDRVEVLLTPSSRRDAEGTVIGVFGVGQDITHIARTHKELRQVANDLKQVRSGTGPRHE